MDATSLIGVLIKYALERVTGSRPFFACRCNIGRKHAFKCQQVSAVPNPLAKEELNLLAKLMGGLEFQKSGNADSGFRVNLFATDEEEE